MMEACPAPTAARMRRPAPLDTRMHAPSTLDAGQAPLSAPALDGGGEKHTTRARPLRAHAPACSLAKGATSDGAPHLEAGTRQQGLATVKVARQPPGPREEVVEIERAARWFPKELLCLGAHAAVGGGS